MNIIKGEKFQELCDVSISKDEHKKFEAKDINIKKDIGFIAQDVQEVLPELVRENEDGKLSLRDKGIVPILVEAIKELKAEIELLKKNHSIEKEQFQVDLLIKDKEIGRLMGKIK